MQIMITVTQAVVPAVAVRVVAAVIRRELVCHCLQMVCHMGL